VVGDKSDQPFSGYESKGIFFKKNQLKRYRHIKNWVDTTLDARWFGFNINRSFTLLYYSLNIDTKYLGYNEEILNFEEKKEMLRILVQICKYTGSKQLIYYVNKWSEGKQLKGFLEFERTFGSWFDFKNDLENNMNTFLDIIQYLSKFLQMNNLLMKNLYNYTKMEELISNEYPNNIDHNLCTIIDVMEECYNILNYNDVIEETTKYYKFGDFDNDHPYYYKNINYEMTITQKKSFLDKYETNVKNIDYYNDFFLKEKIKMTI